MRRLTTVAAVVMLVGLQATEVLASKASVDRVENFQTVVAVAPIEGPPFGALMRADCSFAQIVERPGGRAREILKCQLSDDPVDIPDFQGTPPTETFTDLGGPCIWISDFWAVKDGSTVFAERFQVTVTPSGSVTGRADYPAVPLDCPED